MNQNVISKLDLNNKYIRLYYRILKENNLHTNKEYKSIKRHNDSLKSVEFHCVNTLKYVINIPRLFITLSVGWYSYRNIYAQYIRNIIEEFTPIIVNEILKKYDKTNLSEKKVKFIISKILSLTNKGLDDNVYEFPVDTYIKAIERTLLNHVVLTTQSITGKPYTLLSKRNISEIINNITYDKL